VPIAWRYFLRLVVEERDAQDEGNEESRDDLRPSRSRCTAVVRPGDHRTRAKQDDRIDRRRALPTPSPARPPGQARSGRGPSRRRSRARACELLPPSARVRQRDHPAGRRAPRRGTRKTINLAHDEPRHAPADRAVDLAVVSACLRRFRSLNQPKRMRTRGDQPDPEAGTVPRRRDSSTRPRPATRKSSARWGAAESASARLAGRSSGPSARFAISVRWAMALFFLRRCAAAFSKVCSGGGRGHRPLEAVRAPSPDLRRGPAGRRRTPLHDGRRRR